MCTTSSSSIDYDEISTLAPWTHTIGRNYELIHPIIFYHLWIMASSPLIPRDMSLHLTIHNIIYVLSFQCATTMYTPHRLQLFLNSNNHMSYLRHTHDVDEHTWRRLEITTTLLITRPQFKWSNRRLMMRTTTHSPDLVTTLTFPADSLQHQLSILTLVTHLILSVLCLKQT